MENVVHVSVFRFYLQKTRLIQGGEDLGVIGTRKKSKKNLNETKDMMKHLLGEQLAAVKIESKRKKMRWRLKSADMVGG